MVCSLPDATTWTGVACSNGRVTAISLYSLGLSGETPAAAELAACQPASQAALCRPPASVLDTALSHGERRPETWQAPLDQASSGRACLRSTGSRALGCCACSRQCMQAPPGRLAGICRPGVPSWLHRIPDGCFFAMQAHYRQAGQICRRSLCSILAETSLQVCGCIAHDVSAPSLGALTALRLHADSDLL